MTKEKLFSKCPYCGWANPVTILADLVQYNCKKCKEKYYVKRETKYITITPGLTGGSLEDFSSLDSATL